MGVNMEMAQEVRYVLSKVVQSLPYYSTNAYVDNCDQGIALAVNGLKTLNSDRQYRISVMQVKDGYVFNIPFDSMSVLLAQAMGDSSVIDDKWVYTSQMREENEKNRFRTDFINTVQHLSVMGYVRNIVEKAQQVAELDLDNISVIVSSLAACLAENGGNYNDQILAYVSNVTQSFNQMLMNQQTKDNNYQQAYQQWWQTCKQYYDYMAQNVAFYSRLRNVGDSYIWNIAVAGITQQTQTYHRNIPYTLYGISIPCLLSLLSQFKYPYADISVIEQDMSTVAFDIKTLENQGRSVIKQCAALCDSGNGVLVRLLITPTRKMMVD